MFLCLELIKCFCLHVMMPLIMDASHPSMRHSRSTLIDETFPEHFDMLETETQKFVLRKCETIVRTLQHHRIRIHCGKIVLSRVLSHVKGKCFNNSCFTWNKSYSHTLDILNCILRKSSKRKMIMQLVHIRKVAHLVNYYSLKIRSKHWHSHDYQPKGEKSQDLD